MGRKADDQYTVWACFACHDLIDRSPVLTYEEKCELWGAAFARQGDEWRKIVNDPKEPESARRAAAWALERI